MSLVFFEGPAGSGKTTKLLEELRDRLASGPLREHQKVLALSKMHGSRRRLVRRLAEFLPSHNFNCATIDSFAWRLLRRWRSLGRNRFELAGPSDFELLCSQAGKLLGDESVRRWVVNHYPYVIVDEMQDSRGGQLAIVQRLSDAATCITAADDFQDLSGGPRNEAMEWARGACTPVTLTQIQRTDVAGILEASKALRTGGEVQNGPGFRLEGVPAVGLGAWELANAIRRRPGTLAVLTPVRPEKSAFVRDIVARVELMPIGKQPPIGPYRCPWEAGPESEAAELVQALQLPTDDTLVKTSELDLPSDNKLSAALRSHLDHQRRVCGRKRFACNELHSAISQIAQRRRAYSSASLRGVVAMTIHQAKNREFDSVVVLWPYQASGSDERLRRLLYNAITRAKKRALVVIQNPDRLGKAPFVATKD